MLTQKPIKQGTHQVTEHVTEWRPGAIALSVLRKSGLEQWLSDRPDDIRAWVKANNFTAEAGQVLPVPTQTGECAMVLVGSSETEDPWAFAALPAKLPPGCYALAGALDPRAARWAALAWSAAGYAFTRYKSRADKPHPQLVWPENADRGWVTRQYRSLSLIRDLINTPAADMGPAELAGAAETLAAEYGAKVRVIVGDGLSAENYPAIHAVGRAAGVQRRPRLADLTWGDENAPKVTLVGKGVCFDSGGLDLKSSGNMKLMKKDMGGAAQVLGLALMIMDARLPVRLRVLIPAVENAVSAESMRPLDVLNTRKGLTVEVGNTDAEGRLILCDALAEACKDKPDLLIDTATLTGAARSALGTEISAMFCNDDLLAAEIVRAGDAEADPVWRLPLHKPYRRLLDSKVADISSVSDGPYAGAITAALFLQEFVDAGIPWAHFDLMAWNNSSRPGRPDGGESMAVRALFSVISQRFGTNP